MEGVHPDDVQGASMASCPHYMPESLSGCNIGSGGQMENIAGSLRVVFRDMRGEFAGYIGSNIDITDLKSAEAERERLRRCNRSSRI